VLTLVLRQPGIDNRKKVAGEPERAKHKVRAIALQSRMYRITVQKNAAACLAMLLIGSGRHLAEFWPYGVMVCECGQQHLDCVSVKHCHANQT
jgi:hypothetical protein